MTDIFTFDEKPNEDGPPRARDTDARHGRPRRRKRSKPVMALLISLGVVLALLVVGGVVVGTYVGNLSRTFSANAKQIPHAFPPATTRPTASPTGAMNILLMGSDSRGAATSAGASAPSDQRTDTMMLVHVDADRKNVYVMSIMRDLWVPIPGHGEAKINAAFAYGGTALTIQTVEDLLKVRIDHVAIIDFEGFKGMTEALGGVDVNSPEAFTANGFTYTQGVNHLSGAKALAFVRERHAFATADYQRVKDQQAFVQGLAATVMSRSTLTDPGKISAFTTAMSKYLSVDDTFDLPTIASLAVSLRDVRPADIHTFTIPTAGTGTIDGQSVVNVDQASMPALRTALAGDQLSGFAGPH